MPLLGQGAYGVPTDYSAVGDSAWRLAASTADAIGGLVGKVEDKFEERKQYKDDLKTGKELAKAMKVIYPELSTAIDPYLAQMDDEETPLSSRAALGRDAGTLINAYIRKGELDRNYNLDLAANDRAERGMAIDERRGEIDVQRISNAMQQEEQEAASKAELTQFMARPLLDQALTATAQASKAGERPLIDVETLKRAYNKSPEQQMQIASAALAGLPKVDPVELRDVKFTRDGQPMVGTGYFDPKTGSMRLLPVQDAYGDGSGGQFLPDDIAGDPIKGSIAEAATRYGIPAGHALSIVAQESGFNPNTTMQSSSAKGLFQFLDADRKQYGVSTDSPLPQQIDAGMRKMKDNYDAAKAALGREPTAGELYATYYQGIGAGPAILANPNASFRDTLNQFGEGHANRVIAANPWLKGISTNREFVDWSERKMQSKGFIQAGASTARQPAPQTPAQIRKDELEVAKLEGDIAKQGSDVAIAQRANAAAVEKGKQALASLVEIRNHPGRWAATGKTSYIPSVRGSDAYDFEQKLEKAKALAGTIGIEAMRGLGAMSEKEFEAAKASIAQLEKGQKTETVERELDSLIKLFTAKIGDPNSSPTISRAEELRRKKEAMEAAGRR